MCIGSGASPGGLLAVGLVGTVLFLKKASMADKVQLQSDCFAIFALDPWVLVQVPERPACQSSIQPVHSMLRNCESNIYCPW